MANSPDEYEIGYAKPPKNNQFTKGRSGNPRGRPKGSKNIATIFQEIARQRVVIKENGKARTVTKREAILLQISNKAMSGNLGSTKQFLQLDRELEETGEQKSLDRPDIEKDQAFMKGLMARMQAHPSVLQSEEPMAREEASEGEVRRGDDRI